MNKPVMNTHQPSMTEWFAAIGSPEDAAALRDEDNKKNDRLELLFQEIGLPYERPEAFEATDLTELTPRFAAWLAEHGNELCAIRLVPKDSELPKLRQRGLLLKDTYENWFKQQTIDPDKYTAYVCPHCDMTRWAATFVIRPEGIVGEIVEGLHNQLTHGESVGTIYRFAYDWNVWQWSESNSWAEVEVKRMLDLLFVADQAKQRSLKEKLSSEFANNYLIGYFEATVWPDNKVYIIDYNRVLPKYVNARVSIGAQPDADIRGAIAFPGQAQGRVRIVAEGDLATIVFENGDILVCDNTDVRYLPFMQKAGAIITNRGGILSHAAIVARELKKPCIIGAKNATQVLKDGDLVEVDADQGIVIQSRSG